MFLLSPRLLLPSLSLFSFLSPSSLSLFLFPSRLFSRSISRSYVLGDPMRSRAGNRRLYGRTPVIGWSRFIDGGISLFERAFRPRRAASRSRSRFPPNFRERCDRVFEFPFTRDEFVGGIWPGIRSSRVRPSVCPFVKLAVDFYGNFENFPRDKTLRIKYCIFTVLKRI